MSRWRREASERLPDLQRIVASKDIDSPMMLWIELNQEFERQCEIEPLPLDIQTAAALGFCEHLMDTPKRMAALPKIMKRSDFYDLRNIVEYHNTSEEVNDFLNSNWK